MRSSVVVPARNGVATLGPCLAALVAAAAPDDEIIVVDDGSTDGTDRFVSDHPDPRVVLVRSEVNLGRGPARNLGARRAGGEVLVFVDADVVVHGDALSRIRRAVEDDGVVAVIGSYDDRPGDPGVVSQFRNLLHHHTHHHAGSPASHFWTGLGAVTAVAFSEVGGFDELRWARNMEDVELGHRLNDAGYRIEVDPAIQGCHLKRYTLRSMVRSDLFDRAVPWTRLTLADHRTDRFVLSPAQRAGGLAVGLVPIGVASAVLAPLVWSATVTVVGLAVFGAANRSVWRTLRRVRGRRFLVVAVPLMYVHVSTAVLGFVVGVCGAVSTRLRSGRQVG